MRIKKTDYLDFTVLEVAGKQFIIKSEDQKRFLDLILAVAHPECTENMFYSVIAPGLHEYDPQHPAFIYKEEAFDSTI